MKRFAVVLVILGFLFLIGIYLISFFSENLSSFTKTFGFIILGYLGLAIFAYGWMILFGHNKKQWFFQYLSQKTTQYLKTGDYNIFGD